MNVLPALPLSDYNTLEELFTRELQPGARPVDSTPNHLWEAREADGSWGLLEVGMRRGVALDASGREQAGMGVGAGDLDGDGRADFVVTNFSGENHNLYLSGSRRSYRDKSHQLGVDLRPLMKFRFS